MKRLAYLLLISSVLAPVTESQAQQTNEQLATRCAELGAIWDRYGARRREGSRGAARGGVRGAARAAAAGRAGGVRTCWGRAREPTAGGGAPPGHQGAGGPPAAHPPPFPPGLRSAVQKPP